jgi:hypothetical protein
MSDSAILSVRPVRLLLRIPAIREMLVALAASVASLGTLGTSKIKPYLINCHRRFTHPMTCTVNPFHPMKMGNPT